MEKENRLESVPVYNRIVYLAIPKRLYDNPFIDWVKKRIIELGSRGVADPRNMFKSNEDWRKSFPTYLDAYDCIVVISDNGIIGKGTYEEVTYFQTQGKPVYMFAPAGGDMCILPVKSMHIINWNNWEEYARIKPL